MQRGQRVFVQQTPRLALFVTVRVPRRERHRSMLARLGSLLHGFERGRHVFVHDRTNVGRCGFVQAAPGSNGLRITGVGFAELQQAVRPIGHGDGAFV